jgi:putative oxidoreductase
MTSTTRSKGFVAGFWIVTWLFCLEMLFTAYWELRVLPQAAERFAQLGFPSDSFRVELSLAKVLGVLVLLIPAAPSRLKEWAYAGFALNLISAVIAHVSIHDVPASFVPSAVTTVLWVGSYGLWRRLESGRVASS